MANESFHFHDTVMFSERNELEQHEQKKNNPKKAKTIAKRTKTSNYFEMMNTKFMCVRKFAILICSFQMIFQFYR